MFIQLMKYKIRFGMTIWAVQLPLVEQRKAVLIAKLRMRKDDSFVDYDLGYII